MANSLTLDGTAFNVECRYSNSGTCILTFNLSYYDGKDKDGKAKYGSIQVKLFKELAENAGFVIKDRSHVLVTGRLSQDKWDDKEGKKQYRTVLMASDIGESISRFSQQQGSGQPAARQGQTPSGGSSSFGENVPDEEIPF